MSRLALACRLNFKDTTLAVEYPKLNAAKTLLELVNLEKPYSRTVAPSDSLIRRSLILLPVKITGGCKVGEHTL